MTELAKWSLVRGFCGKAWLGGIHSNWYYGLGNEEKANRRETLSNCGVATAWALSTPWPELSHPSVGPSGKPNRQDRHSHRGSSC